MKGKSLSLIELITNFKCNFFWQIKGSFLSLAQEKEFAIFLLPTTSDGAYTEEVGGKQKKLFTIKVTN